jgi:hypothetical protein
MVVSCKYLLPGVWIDGNIRIDGHMHEDSIDHYIIDIEMLMRELVDVDVREDCLLEPVDDDEGMTDAFIVEKICLKVGNLV